MTKKQKPKFPRAFFKVPMGTQVISPKKGKGAKDLNPYNRKAKHKKSTALDKFDPVVFWSNRPALGTSQAFFIIYVGARGAIHNAAHRSV